MNPTAGYETVIIVYTQKTSIVCFYDFPHNADFVLC